MSPTVLTRTPNTYDEAKIRAQGAAKRSEGVNPDGSIPGYEPTLDRAKAGDNWATVGLQPGGLNLTYVLPQMAGEKTSDAVERFKKTGQHYGAFETEDAGAKAMRAAQKGKSK